MKCQVPSNTYWKSTRIYKNKNKEKNKIKMKRARNEKTWKYFSHTNMDGVGVI